MKRSRAPAGDESGFVLVGVVVFVIALTILGLSLFSLSGFEAQFLGHTLDEQQAFYTAQGGIERAKFALENPPFYLQNVSQDLPLEGVTDLVASQVQNGDTVSTGKVDWTATNYVRIRATGVSNGVSRTTEGWYSPQLADNYYKRLITTKGPIKVLEFSGPSDSLALPPILPTLRDKTVYLGGEIWEEDVADYANWKNHVAPAAPTGVKSGFLPSPEVTDFIDGRTSNALPADYNSNTNTFRLQGNSGQVSYFTSPSPAPAFDPNGFFTLWHIQIPALSQPPTIRVQGYAVWLFPKGVRFDGPVTVLGGPNSCLVIVAGPNGSLPFYTKNGIWFFDGLSSTIPIILVSDGTVLLENFYGSPGTMLTSQLSIFAQEVQLTGPLAPLNQRWELYHTPGDPIDDRIDFLVSQNALPNTKPGSDHKLTLVADTWRDLTP